MSERVDGERGDRTVIVVGVDLTDMSEHLLAKAGEIARSENRPAELHVVHVVRPEPASLRMAVPAQLLGFEERAQIESAERELRRLCQWIVGEADPQFVVHALVGDVSDELTRLARDVGAEVLVVGAHDRGRRTLGRSTIAHIAKDAPCSVFAVRARRASLRPPAYARSTLEHNGSGALAASGTVAS